ncbi:Zn-dependent peptidase ImmA (M78 family) [Paraburkholderia sp. BL18I3N2]|uniref:ImmA/IrrE family metallo-endopeptidase n=1 Tax=Paraburkholderia sp. BL18I3N2 TaxID=1938799 RepID=UPI000D053044|nr:ImmA/IrrE family metallo-endopeptidase [Paraburkholderia sp. BL18I3N2]PRX32226.1 Zn-dependent peptidase ImmA (M78 family) [Paraburkholderia sp. BL18I3N2]
MSDTLNLSPEVLHWAANQVGDSLEDIARTISKRSADKIIAGHLTPSQAVKFAAAARVPFGYLFLPRPPAPRVRPELVDFRTIHAAATPLSRDFFEVYDDVKFKLAWYKDFLEREGAEPLAFVGQGRRQSLGSVQLAANIRQGLQLDSGAMAKASTPEDLFGYLAGRVEATGILVFKNGIVGNNTSRPLSVAEFRGFAISDPVAPAVFINGRDAPAAWMFTLMHEVAHIWQGDSGVSDAATTSVNNDERFCNAVAAEVLVPSVEFTALWEKTNGNLTERLNAMRRHFKVSLLVLARRALEFRFIDESLYRDVYLTSQKSASKAEDSGGGNFYATLAVRNSKKLAKRVASLATSGNISLREAGQLLNTNPNNVVTFYEKQRALPA